jgi:hemolysin III
MDTGYNQTKNEEWASGMIHGIGAGLSLAGMIILVDHASRTGDAWRTAIFGIYGSSLIILYAVSTVYHIVSNPRIKALFHLFDHAAVFLLIAGTYTPFCLITVRGWWGWSIFCIVWGMAILGIVFQYFFIGRFRIASTILYLVTGWIIVIAVKPLLETLPAGGLKWIIFGGACYTFGIIFFAWKKLPFGHFIWHIFVLAGSIFHYFGVLFYVLPAP